MDKWVKIGYTVDVERRINELQTACPKRLKLLALMEGNFETEKALHYMFRTHRAEGEWFRYGSLIENVVHLISQNKFLSLKTLEREAVALGVRRKANRLAKKGNHKLKNRIRKCTNKARTGAISHSNMGNGQML
ncbi:MAG: GIY-YIG nuclease family protein [Candidatus Peribacteraceae bacterium]|nr:GIY-YIG nuclease family protein [Candidatus Peribacteraceae bacterium]